MFLPLLNVLTIRYYKYVGAIKRCSQVYMGARGTMLINDSFHFPSLSLSLPSLWRNDITKHGAVTDRKGCLVQE